jgi:ATP-dependent DNA helicase RecQ
VHYEVPDCLENYYQEAGRAGRDGKRAYAVLLYSNREVENLQEQSSIRFPDEVTIKTVYTALMNYLQVAAGSGEGISFDFDIGTFTSNFKLNVLTATYAIKALEQEDVLSYSEAVFKPSTACLVVNRNDLTEFEKMHPELEEVIKGLLRSYSGIFDYPVTVYEAQLARFIKKDIGSLYRCLQQLQEYGILIYSPQKDKPQVTLLQNRMYNDSYAINMTDYNKRRKNFEDRAGAIIGYIKETGICRSATIAGYFDAHLDKPCGICDNCINQKELIVTKEEFEFISGRILQMIHEKSMPVKDILTSLQTIKKEKFWKVLNFLQAENKINVTKEGQVRR